MNLDQITPGRRPPWDVNVVIEIPVGSEPVKYEVDKASGAVFVDRFLHTSMVYPVNYGFIPHTLAEDGDPVDVLVAVPSRIVPGAVVRCRPIGVLSMTDEAGDDFKVLAVPIDELTPYYKDVSSYRQLPDLLLDQIVHFFQHYKDLEPNKWAEIGGWKESGEAETKILEAIERAAASEAAK